MSEFEYISVLLSIVIGLGITQLLSGIARLVRDGRALAPAWWVIVLVATLLVANLQVWWVSFHWRGITDWTFFSYIAFMILPILLYLLAYLILPADLHLDGAELARAFIDKRKPFYAMVALIPIASLLQQWMLTDMIPPADADACMRLLWLVLAVPGFLSRRIGTQALLAVLSLTLMLTYSATLFLRLR